MILDTMASATMSYDAGAAGTVTVPSGKYVRSIRALGGPGATLTITPKGAGQTGTAGGAIPLPVVGEWFELDMLGEFGPGTVLAFASTVSYFVQYFQPR